MAGFGRANRDRQGTVRSEIGYLTLTLTLTLIPDRSLGQIGVVTFHVLRQNLAFGQRILTCARELDSQEHASAGRPALRGRGTARAGRTRRINRPCLPGQVVDERGHVFRRHHVAKPGRDHGGSPGQPERIVHGFAGRGVRRSTENRFHRRAQGARPGNRSRAAFEHAHRPLARKVSGHLCPGKRRQLGDAQHANPGPTLVAKMSGHGLDQARGRPGGHHHVVSVLHTRAAHRRVAPAGERLELGHGLLDQLGQVFQEERSGGGSLQSALPCLPIRPLQARAIQAEPTWDASASAAKEQGLRRRGAEHLVVRIAQVGPERLGIRQHHRGQRFGDTGPAQEMETRQEGPARPRDGRSGSGRPPPGDSRTPAGTAPRHRPSV